MKRTVALIAAIVLLICGLLPAYAAGPNPVPCEEGRNGDKPSVGDGIPHDHGPWSAAAERFV